MAEVLNQDYFKCRNWIKCGNNWSGSNELCKICINLGEMCNYFDSGYTADQDIEHLEINDQNSIISDIRPSQSVSTVSVNTSTSKKI